MHYAKCRILLFVIFNDAMLSVVMLSVAMLSVTMLSVAMLRVVMLHVVIAECSYFDFRVLWRLQISMLTKFFLIGSFSHYSDEDSDFSL